MLSEKKWDPMWNQADDPFYQCCGVKRSCKVLIDMDTQEYEAGHPLHPLPIDVASYLFNDFFGLFIVESQVIVSAPHYQPHSFSATISLFLVIRHNTVESSASSTMEVASWL